MIERTDQMNYVLSMSVDGSTFEKKYSFCLDEVSISDFHTICYDKQTNPESYFVKNLICTKPTREGRLTIFNNKFVERRNGERTEVDIVDDEDLRNRLINKFGIVIQDESKVNQPSN